MKPIKIIETDISGKIIAEYPSLYAAARAKSPAAQNGQANILRCLNGKYETAYGSKWKRG